MYLHQHTCISPQHIINDLAPDKVPASVEGKLAAREPVLEGVPPGMLRRMSKAVRMGLAAGLPIVKNNHVDGIIIGTANGGMEDCIKFLNQIVDYDEGLLTPGNFVQSTANAIAGQLSMLAQNRSYNATHVHLGLAFENALLDAQMWLKENPEAQMLIGGVDEISTYNFNIDKLAGWYDTAISNNNLYHHQQDATIAGEGAAMFLVNNEAKDAVAKITAISTLHTENVELVAQQLQSLVAAHGLAHKNCLFINGFNGDNRMKPFSDACARMLEYAGEIYYKHVSGEYPTAAAFAVWLGIQALAQPYLPGHFYKSPATANPDNVIIYNGYHGRQHSFIILSR